jgi:hypothetical protein
VSNRRTGDDTVALRGDEDDSRIQQLLLLEKNIESRALTDLRFCRMLSSAISLDLTEAMED